MSDLPIGEVVISTSPTGWQVVKWAEDALPIKVGMKLYTRPQPAPEAVPAEDAFVIGRAAGLEAAVRVCAARITGESGRGREDHENRQCAAAIRALKKEQA